MSFPTHEAYRHGFLLENRDHPLYPQHQRTNGTKCALATAVIKAMVSPAPKQSLIALPEC